MLSLDSVVVTSVVRPEDLLASHRHTWSVLCQKQADLASPFYSLAFAQAVARAGPTVRVCVIEEAGSAPAFFPFQFRDPLARALGRGERVGGEMSDYAGIVADPSLRLSPAHLIRAARLVGYRFSHLPASQLQFGLTATGAERGLQIDLSAGSDLYLQRLWTDNGRARQESLRRERRLSERLGPLELVFRESSPHAALDALIYSKRAQYWRTGVTDALASTWKRRLLHQLAELDEPDCAGVLSTLRAGNVTVAAHFGIRRGSTLHYWFPVYATEYHAFGPGRLMLQKIIEAATENGVRLIDRGAGASPAKQFFANVETRLFDGLWARSGLRNTAANAIDGVAWRWELAHRRVTRRGTAC